MKLVPCRDCGYMLDPTSRGCPQCARNLVAERMIERGVWWVAALILCVAVAFVLVYLRR